MSQTQRGGKPEQVTFKLDPEVFGLLGRLTAERVKAGEEVQGKPISTNQVARLLVEEGLKRWQAGSGRRPEVASSNAAQGAGIDMGTIREDLRTVNQTAFTMFAHLGEQVERQLADMTDEVRELRRTVAKVLSNILAEIGREPGAAKRLTKENIARFVIDAMTPKPNAG